jgi:ABC-type nickel/cobalt efflux system permease component RcnA
MVIAGPRALRRALCLMFVALAALLLTAAIAVAQGEPPRPPLGVGAAVGAQPAPPSGWWAQAVAAQQAFLRDMATAVRGLKSADPWNAALVLIGLSFVYGVLHAAGPGHGKAVISSYVLANRETARRGIALSFLAAFFQACAAVLFVAVLALLLKATSLQMKSAEAWIERVSWALVLGIGVWLLWRQVAPLLTARRVAAAGAGHGRGDHAHAHAASHAAAHAHASAHAGHGHTNHVHAHHHSSHTHSSHTNGSHAHSHATHTHATHTHGAGCTHAHEPDHAHGPDCGHAHMPTPQQLQGPWSWRNALGIALGIGIRPCTGAILVMLFALGQGLLWAGVLATFMMSLGTALTVSFLAVLAVTSRDLALRWSGASSTWGASLAAVVGIAGAVLLVGLGAAGLAYPTPEPLMTTR